MYSPHWIGIYFDLGTGGIPPEFMCTQHHHHPFIWYPLMTKILSLWQVEKELGSSAKRLLGKGTSSCLKILDVEECGKY